MGLIDTIKPLSAYLKTGTIYKSQQHQNIFLRMLRIEPGTAVCEKRDCYLSAMQPLRPCDLFFDEMAA